MLCYCLKFLYHFLYIFLRIYIYCLLLKSGLAALPLYYLPYFLLLSFSQKIFKRVPKQLPSVIFCCFTVFRLIYGSELYCMLRSFYFYVQYINTTLYFKTIRLYERLKSSSLLSLCY